MSRRNEEETESRSSLSAIGLLIEGLSSVNLLEERQDRGFQHDFCNLPADEGIFDGALVEKKTRGIK